MQDDGSLKDINSGYAYFKNIEDARKSHDKIIDERYNNAYKLITENVWRTDSIRDNNNTMPDCYGVLEVKNDGTYAGMVYSSNEGAVLVREVGTYQAVSYTHLDVYKRQKGWHVLNCPQKMTD